MFQLYLKKEGEKLCLEWKFQLYSFQATVSLSVSVQLYSEMVVILAITAIATASTAIFSSLWIMLSFYQKTSYTETNEENACS